MYVVLGREVLGDLRFGKYRVRFATKCPRDSDHLYLVSAFTAYMPGRVELRRDSRGLCSSEILLPEGEYLYIFVDPYLNYYPDPDNTFSREVEFFGRKLRFSVAEIEVSRLEKAIRSGMIYPEYIEHDERDPAYFSMYLDYYIIRIRALKNNISGACVEIEGSWGRRCYDMEKVYEDKYYSYYEAVIRRNFDRYRFKLNLRGEEVLYGVDGIYSEKFFEIEKIAGVDRELWWIGSVYYQIFPDSFYNADPSNDPPDKISPEKIPRERGFIGGDLRGIIERLNYVRSLGVDAIYLNPIHPSPSYHRYDVIDYRSVDGYLGDLEDFKNLVREAHERGIRVVLDLVPYHASPCSQYFVKALEGDPEMKRMFKLLKDPGSLEQDYMKRFREYIESRCRKPPTDMKPFYESFLGSWSMVRWDHFNPKVSEFFIDIIRYWSSLGVDGFRIDVGHGIPDESLKKMYRALKEFEGDERIFIIELMGELRYYPMGVIADSAMNYELRNAILNFLLYRSIDAYQFIYIIGSQYVSQPYYAVNSLYNLLGSHDTPRIFTLAGGDLRILINMYTILFTLPGSPAIYYGDEIGLEGGGDPDNRRYMLWDENRWNKILLEHIRNLARIRRSFKALRTGFTRFQAIDRDSIALLRYLPEGERILTVVTRDRSRHKMIIPMKIMKILRLNIPRSHIIVNLRRGERILHIRGGKIRYLY